MSGPRRFSPGPIRSLTAFATLAALMGTPGCQPRSEGLTQAARAEPVPKVDDASELPEEPVAKVNASRGLPEETVHRIDDPRGLSEDTVPQVADAGSLPEEPALPDTVHNSKAVDWGEWLRPPPPDQPQPRFACDAVSIDLGSLWTTGWQPVKAWRLRNEGQAPLRMRILYSCNTDPVEPAGFTILPGQSRDISMKVQVSRWTKSGTFVVQALTNDALRPQVRLAAACTVLCWIRMEPTYLKFNPVPAADLPVTQTVTLTQADAGPIQPQILAVKIRKFSQPQEWELSSSDRIEVSIREIEQGVRYEVDVAVQAPWPAGGNYIHGRVCLGTGVTEIPEIEILFTIVPENAPN